MANWQLHGSCWFFFEGTKCHRKGCSRKGHRDQAQIKHSSRSESRIKKGHNTQKWTQCPKKKGIWASRRESCAQMASPQGWIHEWVPGTSHDPLVINPLTLSSPLPLRRCPSSPYLVLGSIRLFCLLFCSNINPHSSSHLHFHSPPLLLLHPLLYMD